jgi:DNA-binding MarR family transcriptional regulator
MAAPGDPSGDVAPSAIAVRIVTAIYREFEHVARAGDITMAQYRLLYFLQAGPQRAGAIATAAALAKPTVSLTLNGLRERGWVENVPDPDGRASMVVLTAAGEARLASFETELAAKMAELVEDPAAEAALEAGLLAAYRAMDARLTRILTKVRAKI